MVDLMVKATQQWLNATYRGKHGYNVIAEDGVTGWGTIHALTRALQIEMGIEEPSDNFGSQTMQKYEASPLVAPSDSTVRSNRYAILQGALWCKGYDAGHYKALDDHYDGSVIAAVASLKSDAGLEANGRRVEGLLMKSLLSILVLLVATPAD